MSRLGYNESGKDFAGPEDGRGTFRCPRVRKRRVIAGFRAEAGMVKMKGRVVTKEQVDAGPEANEGLGRPRLGELLQELRGLLQQLYGEKLRGLYLYGSHARQEADPESDVDVIIVLKDFGDYWEEVQRTGSIISDLSLKYDVSISPVRLREVDWLTEDSPFLNSARREAIAL